jgi:hypothetical protein
MPGRLGYRWSRSPTIRRTAAPLAADRLATDRRNRPRGRASSPTRARSAAASSTAEVATSVTAGPASSSEVAEPRPQGPCAALGG